MLCRLERRTICKASRRILCKASDRPVFHTPHAAACNVKLDLYEIETLISLGETMNERSKIELFYAHGADYDRVREYYVSVRKLETCYDISKNIESRQKFDSLRFGLAYLIRLFVVLFRELFRRP